MNTTTSHAAAVPARTPVFGTLIGSMRPSARVPAVAFDAACVLLGSLVIALSAKVAFPIGPVPITGQTFAVLLIGAVLGPWLGLAACVAYLIEGLCGLPVFAIDTAGFSFGYILGFIPGAWVVGSLCAAGWDRTPWRAAAAMVLGLVPIFAAGLFWLAMFHVETSKVLSAGLFPFIPGEAVKVAAAALLIPSARTAVEMLRRK